MPGTSDVRAVRTMSRLTVSFWEPPIVNAMRATWPSFDGMTLTGSLRPATLSPSVSRRSMAATVAGAWASVTTMSRVRSVPCGHFSFWSRIPATPSIVDGKPVMSVTPVRRCSTG